MNKLTKRIDLICFMAIIFAAIGFSVENVYRMISNNIIDNRFHILPYIGVYGLIPLALLIIGKPDNFLSFIFKYFKKNSKISKIISNIIYLLMIFLIVGAGEIIVGSLFETFADVQLWNYSTKFMHIGKYTCFNSIVGFGLGTYIISKFIFFPLFEYLEVKFSNYSLKWYRYFYLVLILDMLIMVLKTFIMKTKMNYYSIIIPDGSLKVVIIISFILIVILFNLLMLYILFKIPKENRQRAVSYKIAK